MSTWQKLVIAFWIFIGIMLLWNFSSYNRSLTQEAAEHPQQQHFYFFHTNAPAANAPGHREGPDVQQTAFKTLLNDPVGSFTCVVTLKNVGTVKATNVQICIRPFRGVSTADPDVGLSFGGVLSEDDPLSQYNDWLSFPDLAPGESSTQTDVFLNHPGISPGINPHPKIIFEAPKPAPGAAQKPGN